MVVADIVTVRKQVLEKLAASPKAARYTDAIGDTSDYAVLGEITDAIMMIDAEICGVDIIGTAGHPWRQRFMVPSGNLQHGEFVPAHTGAHGDVQVSIGGIFDFAARAKSRDEVLQMRRFQTLYGQSRHYFIEDSVVSHNGDFAKVWYPDYVQTGVLQGPKTYELLYVYGALQALEKLDSDDAYFNKERDLYLVGRKLIREGSMILPPQEQLEAMVRKEAA